MADPRFDRRYCGSTARSDYFEGVLYGEVGAMETPTEEDYNRLLFICGDMLAQIKHLEK